jgi:hypothetical protein
MPFVKNFFQNFFTQNFIPFPRQPDIYSKTTIMKTPKTTPDKLTITIPLKETCGESMETAIEISGVHFNQIIPIESSIIHYLMDDMHWTKAEQSLIFANDKKYDKIGVIGLVDDGSISYYDFWFDITECFGE